MVKVCICLAPGFEECEALVPTDFLRRAGAEVILAAVGTPDLLVQAAQKVTVKADVKFDDVQNEEFDAIICPGGMPGTTNLAKHAPLIVKLKKQVTSGKLVAAICAAPGFVLAEAAQILNGKHACGYPGTDDLITKNGGIKSNDPVVVDGNIITSRAPGTAYLFALALIKYLFDQSKADEIAKGTLLK